MARGYRLGFESSSDHVSTHISYGVLFVKDVSRQAIIDAFKQRHCYAATDNIVLVVRSGNHLMGESFETSERPTLSIEAEGTAPIAKFHVVRDNKYIYTAEPNEKRLATNVYRQRSRTGQDELLLRSHRAGRRQPGLGLADVDHLQKVGIMNPAR